MLQYRNVTIEDAEILSRYYENCSYELCEYSVGTKLMWKENLKPQWTEVAGCLVVKNIYQKETLYEFPVAGPDGDLEAALLAIEEEVMENGGRLCFSSVPESRTLLLLKRYPYVRISKHRTWNDYIYRAEDIAKFEGRHYSGQRNHIHKFEKACPNARFAELTESDAPAIERFWKEFEEVFVKSDAKAREELGYAKQMLKLAGKPYFRCGAFFDEDRIIALALAEKCGNTMIIHIEKALYFYEGIYPAFVRAFAQHFGGDVTYLNREDDAGDAGLRRSKLQYRPVKLGEKLICCPSNDIQERLKKIPSLETERLTLDAITLEDADDYNAIVLDKERNIWWGYDDEGSLKEPRTKESFYQVAQRDWEHRTAVNFAIRLDGKMIGEAVLYNFDFKGGAELGVRISSDYAKCGYGREAFQGVISWALYSLQMRRIFAKCYHENEASYKMLSSCMRKVRRDETFTYFECLV